ncbi:hypothetical protein, partial [Caballeronia sp. GACF5]|uniref:hypothetical protein n=1 Tax=Caballeronia sp. GACF5 TaxID=2921746 RepID=UPI002027B9C9
MDFIALFAHHGFSLLGRKARADTQCAALHLPYCLKYPPGVIVVVASELSYQEESEVQVEGET